MSTKTMESPQWRLSMFPDELAGPLRQLRVALHAITAVVVYTPLQEVSRVLVMDSGVMFEPNEPVRVDRPWKPDVRTARTLTLSSVMRPLRVSMGRSLVLPFADASGSGIIALGSKKGRAEDVDHAVVVHFTAEIARLRSRVGKIRHADVDRAYRLVATAATSDVSVDRVFDLTLAAARNITAADVAYLALPVDDDHFGFSQTLGINTSKFRDLKVATGDGLGGAARAIGKPVRSLNYSEDRRLRVAMLDETRDEGIFSAMATPVREGGDVEAVLYVASRCPRAYSEDDERILADFASATLLGLGRGAMDESRRELIQQEERARIAQKLHDGVVRRLIQIDFAAGALKPASSDEVHVAAINANVSECISLVRDELRSLLDDAAAYDTSLRTVVQRVFSVPSLTDMNRSATIPVPGDGRSVRVPEDVAEAMIRIGQEAVFNAEIHSGGRNCTVEFLLAAGSCTMRISDDGTSYTASDGASGHYGTGLIRQEARKVGGDVEFLRNSGGGLVVSASFPVPGHL